MKNSMFSSRRTGVNTYAASETLGDGAFWPFLYSTKHQTAGELVKGTIVKHNGSEFAITSSHHSSHRPAYSPVSQNVYNNVRMESELDIDAAEMMLRAEGRLDPDPIIEKDPHGLGQASDIWGMTSCDFTSGECVYITFQTTSKGVLINRASLDADNLHLKTEPVQFIGMDAINSWGDAKTQQISHLTLTVGGTSTTVFQKGLMRLTSADGKQVVLEVHDIQHLPNHRVQLRAHTVMRLPVGATFNKVEIAFY